MAFAYDTLTLSSAFAAGPWTFTHVGGTNVTYAKVFVIRATSTVGTTGALFNGQAMSQVGTTAVDTAGEPAYVQEWEISNPAGIGDGSQTVTLQGSGSQEMFAVCITYTGAGGQSQDFKKVENDTANPSITIDTGAATGTRWVCFYSGLSSSASVTPPAGYTLVATAQFSTLGKHFGIYKQDTPSSGSGSITFTSTSDDVALSGSGIVSTGSGNAVSGTVTQKVTGAGISGINLALTGTGSSTGTNYTGATTSGGVYSIQVASGWSGTIGLATSETNRTFTPTTLSVSNVTAGSTSNDFQVLTNYFVNYSTGNDSNAGTSASPLKTFASADSKLLADEVAEYAAVDHTLSGVSLTSSNDGVSGHPKIHRLLTGGRFIGSPTVDGLTITGRKYTILDNWWMDQHKDALIAGEDSQISSVNLLKITRAEGSCVQLEGTTNGGKVTIDGFEFSDSNLGFRSGHKYPDVNYGNSYSLANGFASYCCGKGCLGRWDGAAGSAVGETVGHRNMIYDIFKVSDSEQFACHHGGKITHYNGTSWSEMTTPSRRSRSAIWGTANNSIWAVGTRGSVWFYNGTTWSIVSASLTPWPLLAVHGSSASNVWACGKAGVIFKWDGSTWSAVVSGTSSDLHSIYVTDANNIMVCGSGGLVRTTSDGGANWTTRTTLVATKLRKIKKNSTYFFIVGEGDTVLRSTDGIIWSVLTPGTTDENFRSLAVSDSIIWVGGYSNDAPILRSSTDNGNNWTDRGSLAVHTNLGWPTNDINFNALEILSGGGLLIGGGLYNESSDGIADTQSSGNCSYTNVSAYENGDDGFDIYNIRLGNTHTFTRCYSFDNDPFNELDADGNGFKMGVGQAAASGGVADCILIECVAAGNSRRGFDQVSPMRNTLRNCTSVRNGEQGIYEALEITNCISVNNIGVDINATSGTYSYIMYGTGTITGGTHLFVNNPQFTDPNNYDFTLKSISPAINVGSDIGYGNDLGAYQFVGVIGLGNQTILLMGVG